MSEHLEKFRDEYVVVVGAFLVETEFALKDFSNLL